MKGLVCTMLFCMALSVSSIAQDDNMPKEVTPQLLQKITAAADKEAQTFKASLSTEEYNTDEIEYATDTFRIQRIAEKRMEIDFSTAGMNEAMRQAAAAYDKLLNKYYNKLLALLEPKDKQVLIKTQKAWIAFRDGEKELINTLTKEQYSGGGSIQTLVYTSSVSELTIQRCDAIFNYFNNTTSTKE